MEMKEIYHLLNSYINYFIISSAAILLLACFIEKTHLVPCPGLCLFYTAITPVCNCSDSVLIRNTPPGNWLVIPPNALDYMEYAYLKLFHAKLPEKIYVVTSKKKKICVTNFHGVLSRAKIKKLKIMLK